MSSAMCLTIVLLVLTNFKSQVMAAPASTPIPDYVLTYAPVVWLQSQDPYLPSDIGAQLLHTKPEVNYAPVQGAPSPLTLDNLDSLNALGNTSVYLTSQDDINMNPSWLNGVAPDASGKTNGAVSCVIVVNDKGGGNVDAFYFYFYAYNQGNYVDFLFVHQELGDHVGDWEHNMIRFSNGKPTAVWFSQHSNGEAFTWDAVEKRGNRVVAYSAKGSHATYAIQGTHDHTIPNLNLPKGILNDQTDQGKLWDPILSAYSYQYTSAKTFAPYGNYPTAYLNYGGQWGDQQYKDSDSRQKSIVGQHKYVSGPNGPIFKQLDRKDVCPDNGNACIIRPFLVP
ncbi:MAG: hypothetical protein M1835_007212 [Candelina submexicana]|nr:MAG: hypothetical protein M1835_007212 [Candelina submexicana]